jgi:hypothetical protein
LDDGMAKEIEICGATFDNYVCQKSMGHGAVKHEDNREGHWHMWTDAGKVRELGERAERARRAEIEKEPF